MMGRFGIVAVLLGWTGLVQAQVVDHVAISFYDQLTPAQIAFATSLRVLVVDRSVGGILFMPLCMDAPYASDQNACKRYLHIVPAFNNVQETWTNVVSYGNVHFYGWPGSGIAPELPCGLSANIWGQKLGCFSAYIAAHASDYDVVILLPSYLDAPEATGYLSAMQNLRAAYPALRVALATSSLPRAPMGLAGFNAAVRATSTFPLWDVADVESHDQQGNPGVDNHDGVSFTTPSCSEHWPDDGIEEEAIVQNYTRECDGGHPGNPDVGKIRLLKALWVLLATL